MNYRFARIAVIAAIGATTLTAAGGAAGANVAKSSSAPMRFLLDVPLTSPTAKANGEMEVAGAKAAVAAVNKAGGVLGHKLVLSVVDDGGDSTTAVTKLDAAINSSSKPEVYFSAGDASVESAALPITTRNKILSFGQSPTATSANPKVSPYNFDVSPAGANFAEPFCPFVKAHGGKSVAILHGDDGYSDPLAQAMQTACTADGVKVTGNQAYDVTSLDMTPQLQTLEAGHPDYLLLSAYGAPAGYVLQDIQKLGWKIPVLGDTAVGASAVVYSAPPTGFMGTNLEGKLLVQTYPANIYHPAADNPAPLNALLKGIKAQGPVPQTLVLSAYMYDAVYLAVAGAKAAGSVTNTAAIAKAIVKLKPGGPPTAVFPSYHFTAKSHAPNVSASEFTFAKITPIVNGQFGAPGAK